MSTAKVIGKKVAALGEELAAVLKSADEWFSKPAPGKGTYRNYLPKSASGRPSDSRLVAEARKQYLENNAKGLEKSIEDIKNSLRIQMQFAKKRAQDYAPMQMVGDGMTDVPAFKVLPDYAAERESERAAQLADIDAMYEKIKQHGIRRNKRDHRHLPRLREETREYNKKLELQYNRDKYKLQKEFDRREISPEEYSNGLKILQKKYYNKLKTVPPHTNYERNRFQERWKPLPGTYPGRERRKFSSPEEAQAFMRAEENLNKDMVAKGNVVIMPRPTRKEKTSDEAYEHYLKNNDYRM